MWFCWLLIREQETTWWDAVLQPWHGQRNKGFGPIQLCTERLWLCEEPEEAGPSSQLGSAPAPSTLGTSWMDHHPLGPDPSDLSGMVFWTLPVARCRAGSDTVKTSIPCWAPVTRSAGAHGSMEATDVTQRWYKSMDRPAYSEETSVGPLLFPIISRVHHCHPYSSGAPPP